MRIRKHAKKISPLQFSGCSLKPETLLHTHVCRLNQSPWDVISFPHPAPPPPPSLPQVVDRDDSFTDRNGSFGDSIGAVESVASMKISFDGAAADDNCLPVLYPDRGMEEDDRENEEDFKDWHCRNTKANDDVRRSSAKLTTFDNASAQSLSHSKKYSEKLPPESSRRRSRAKKKAISNPHEFYYYSGFGPLWGKKRGPSRAEPSIRSPSKPEFSDTARAATPSSSSQIYNEVEFDFVEEEEEEAEEEEEEEEEEAGKKRARKPIKARSLKSLM